MKKISAILLCIFMFLSAGCVSVEKAAQQKKDEVFLTMTDAAGRHVVLARQPQRVVSLSPSYLGMIEAVGGKIVGRAASKVGSVPQSMQAVPEVGLVYNINMESLVSLKPDLVLAGRNQHDKFVPLLESNNIQVIEFDAKTYSEVKDTLTLLGKIYGTSDKAEQAIANLDKSIDAVRKKIPASEHKRVVIMFATANSVTVAGSHSIAGCISDLLGFENIAAQALGKRTEKTVYSMESLAEQNPELIFITSMGKPAEIENRLRHDFKNNPAWDSLNAVKNGKTYVLPENLFLLNPGLEYPKAVEFMARQVYPEAFQK